MQPAPPETASSTPVPAEPTPPATAPSTLPAPPTDTDLVEALKRARKEVAAQAKLPSGSVVPTELLEAVARLKPTTIAQLADVPDFGPTRAERYGKPLLECVRSHVDVLRAAGGTIALSSEVQADGTTAPSVGTTPSASSSGTAGAAADGKHVVTIRYSHYSQAFPISTGGGSSLDFGLVDAAYRLSHVFKGEFKVRLRRGEGQAATEIRPDGGRISLVDAAGKRAAGGTFSGLQADAECALVS